MLKVNLQRRKTLTFNMYEEEKSKKYFNKLLRLEKIKIKLNDETNNQARG